MIPELLQNAFITFIFIITVIICYKFVVMKIYGGVQMNKTMIKDLRESYAFLYKRK
jgi:hypothetical protein